MKKQLLFIFTALLSLAIVSCEKTTEKVEIQENNPETTNQPINQSQEVESEPNNTFEELKQEADEATREAKERIKYSEAEKAARSFEELKREAEEANRKAKKN